MLGAGFRLTLNSDGRPWLIPLEPRDRTQRSNGANLRTAHHGPEETKARRGGCAIVRARYAGATTNPGPLRVKARAIFACSHCSMGNGRICFLLRSWL